MNFEKLILNHKIHQSTFTTPCRIYGPIRLVIPVNQPANTKILARQASLDTCLVTNIKPKFSCQA